MMRLGAQLFTLRDYTQTAQDLDRSLEQVARMGYQTVQVSAIGPIPAQQVREICDKHGLQVVLTHWNPDRILNDTEAVIEEHNVMGGLGEAVASYLSEVHPTPVTKIGVNDVFGHSGPAVDLLKEFGLCAENIEATVKKVLGK